jgi:hypothetical protein
MSYHFPFPFLFIIIVINIVIIVDIMIAFIVRFVAIFVKSINSIVYLCMSIVPIVPTVTKAFRFVYLYLINVHP